MAALIQSLDNLTPIQTGENGHAEYGWSNSIQEQILQFSFQLTRTNAGGVAILKSILGGILFQLKRNHHDSDPADEVALNYLIVLYKIIGQTRDIIDGKGECQLTYMMIHTWYEYYPELAFHALKCLVNIGEDGVHQYGSWKDIKYFCHYCLQQEDVTVEHPLIQTAIGIINNQLRVDASAPLGESISLVAKWVPREKSSKFGGKLYAALAAHYFVRYIMSSNNADEYKRKESQAAAILKSKADYRKLIAGLNKRIDTLQIKQCGKTWADIDFNKVTSVSLSKQKRAFLNISKVGESRDPENEDRNTCAEHFKEHIEKAVRGETEVKGKRVGMNDFTKMAIELNRHRRNETECDLLNSQWRDNSQQTNQLGNFIAMVDVSGSMEGEPLNAAIALGIRIAEKSKLGKRVMTFSEVPTWVNLEGIDDFVSMVSVISKAHWGINTNFGAALQLILDAIVAAKISPAEVQDMVLVILSDMQMDAAQNKTGLTTLFDEIQQKYADAGNALFGEPYKAPHILFWNLKSTSGFPTTSNRKNATMVSGFSPAFLNLFCEKGIDSLQSTSPWTLLESSLSNSRYSIMESKAREVFTTKNPVPVDYQELKEFLMPYFVHGYFSYPII
jgi:hypothetical protein